MTTLRVPGVHVRARSGGWRIRAGNVAELAQLAVTVVGEPRVESLEVDVERWRPPRAGWLGTLRLPGVRSVRVDPDGGGAQVRLALSSAADPSLALAAVVRLLRPAAPLGTPAELTLAPGLGPETAALAGWLRDVLRADEERDAHVRRCDTLVCASSPGDSPARTRTVEVGPSGWTVGDRVFPVSVDPAVHRPVGRRSVGERTVGTATVDGDGVVVDAPAGRVVVRGDLGPADVAALRAVAAVVGRGLPPRLAQQLAACGVVVAEDAAELPSGSDDGEAALAWQERSVHERRHALREHGPWAALDAWPSVSVVLVTHRPEQVAHALDQVRRLAYPRLEVVVGLHGDRMDAAAVAAAARDLPHPTTVVAVDGARTLGEALQQCSDRAEGELVTKMDDDDHYGVEHVWDLVLARAYSGAQVVGKTLDWIHLERAATTVLRPVYAAEKYASFVAGGTMLVSRADLAAVGGWRPVPKSVDRALLDRVLADGGLVYRTHGLGYVYVRRAADRTASVRDEHFLTRTAATFDGLLARTSLGTG